MIGMERMDHAEQIRCCDLSLGYDGKAVCEPISFSVRQGDYLCIVGDNGSGKSTLMKTLLRLMPPLSGEIRFGVGLCSHEIGYLPQQGEHQRDFPASVWEVVLSGRVGVHGFRFFPDRVSRTKAKEAMRRLGMEDLASCPFSALSGGQKQRVLLARALCAAGKLLLLDEPVSGLDPAGTAELYNTVRRLHREGVTVIMITHDLAAVAKDATVVLHMGRVPTFYASTEEYLAGPDFPGNGEDSHG